MLQSSCIMFSTCRNLCHLISQLSLSIQADGTSLLNMSYLNLPFIVYLICHQMTRRTTGVQFKYKSMKLKKSHTNLQWTVVKMEICSMIFSMMKTQNIRQIVYCCWLRMGLQSKETCMRPRCMDTHFYTVVHNVSILAERVFLCDDLDNLTDFCLCSCCWF